MNSAVKITIGAAVVVGLYFAYRAAQNALADFAYKIVGYGVPKLDSSYRLTLPVNIRFNNPTPVSLAIDNVLIDVYLLKSGIFEHVGRVSQPITLEPGITIKEAIPEINLRSIFADIFQTVKNLLSTKTLTLRTDVTITYKGFTLPMQSSTDNVNLS